MPGGEKRRDGWAAPPVAWGGAGVVASPVCAPGAPQIARGGQIGAPPRGQPWTSAGTLPPGRNGLIVWRLAVLSTLRAPSLCRHVHHELLRSVWLDVTPLIAATACHQGNDVERYTRFMGNNSVKISCPTHGVARWLLAVRLSPLAPRRLALQL